MPLHARYMFEQFPPTPCPIMGGGWFILQIAPDFSYRIGPCVLVRTIAPPSGPKQTRVPLPLRQITGPYMGWQFNHAMRPHRLKRALLVCAHTHGPRPSPSHVIRHLDGDHTNDAPDNLLWGTMKENNADKRRHGTAGIGERHHMAKLTEEQARAIILDTRACTVVAKVYGVSHVAVSNIRTGRRWQALRTIPRPTYDELHPTDYRDQQLAANARLRALPTQ